MSDFPEKQIPEGTCPPQHYHHPQYIHHLCSLPNFYQYVLEKNHIFSKIVVVRSNTKSGIWSCYHHATNMFLLSAQQQGNTIGCNYIISLSSTPNKGESFVGKLRGNFAADQFLVFDKGKKQEFTGKNTRKQLAQIIFKDKSMWGKSNKSKVIVNVPKPIKVGDNFDPSRVQTYSPCSFPSLLQEANPIKKAYEAKSDKIETMYDAELKCPSKLLSLELADQVECLGIKKISGNQLSLMVGFPLTILQGFSICLSVIQRNGM